MTKASRVQRKRPNPWNRSYAFFVRRRLSSATLKAETSNNPDAERRYEVEVLLLLARDTIPLGSQVIQRAKGTRSPWLRRLRCAAFERPEAGNADVLLSAHHR